MNVSALDVAQKPFLELITGRRLFVVSPRRKIKWVSLHTFKMNIKHGSQCLVF